MSFLCLGLSSQNVGLVLSGGGAKGLTHIGIIHALEDNGIPIDFVTGTSIGAVIGSLYAMGYTPEEMLELVSSSDFRRCYSNEIDEDNIYYIKKNDPTPEFLKLSSAVGDSLGFANSLPANLINPAFMNLKILELFAQATAACKNDFDGLFVPFRCVASNVYDKQSIVFKDGDLGNAVRASMTFPFVFKPIEIDGRLMYDGGIFNNFPADVMKQDFHPDFIIGSAVSRNSDQPSSDDLLGQLEAMIMERSNYALPDSAGILLQFDLSKDIGLLDFDQARRLHDLGYQATLEIIDSIRMKIPRVVTADELSARRSLYRFSYPPVIFRNIYIRGVDEGQRKYIMSEIRSAGHTFFTLQDFRRGYFRLLSDNSISEIVPQAVYNPSDGTFDLYLSVVLKNELTLSMGGAFTTGNINQIYFGIGYNHLGRRSMEVLLDGQVGRTYNNINLMTRLNIPSSVPMSLRLIGSYSTIDYYKQDYLFSSANEPSLNKQQEAFAKFKVALPFVSHQKAELGIGRARIVDSYVPGNMLDFNNLVYDSNVYRLTGGSLFFGENSLNGPQYATQGRSQRFLAQVFTGTNCYRSGRTRIPDDDKDEGNVEPISWLQMSYVNQQYVALPGSFALGTYIEGFFSSRNFAQNFTATMMQTNAFAPTPSMTFTYNSYFRSDTYAAFGLMPIYNINNIFHVRMEGYAFVPLRPVLQNMDGNAFYGDYFSRVGHIEEISLVGRFSSIVASAYLHHDSSPQNPWNVGIAIGWMLFNHRFIER